MVPEFRFMEHCWLVLLCRRSRGAEDFVPGSLMTLMTMPAVQPSTHEVKVTDMVKDGRSGYDNHVANERRRMLWSSMVNCTAMGREDTSQRC